MASWLRLKLEQAGLSQSLKTKVLAMMTLALVFFVAQDLFHIPLLSIAATVATLALGLEALSAKARARGKRIRDEWPTVLESLQSAAQTNMSLLDSLRDLGESSQLLVAKDFEVACEMCDKGVRLDEALEKLKPRFGLAMCDATIETLRLVNDSGGTGFVAALGQQAKSIRESSNISQQIAAKQGWVLGTAKVAVAAPWFIVVLLATRPENASAYSSTQGSMLLLAGLLASVLAIRLINIIGGLEDQRRVFA